MFTADFNVKPDAKQSLRPSAEISALLMACVISRDYAIFTFKLWSGRLAVKTAIDAGHDHSRNARAHDPAM